MQTTRNVHRKNRLLSSLISSHSRSGNFEMLEKRMMLSTTLTPALSSFKKSVTPVVTSTAAKGIDSSKGRKVTPSKIRPIAVPHFFSTPKKSAITHLFAGSSSPSGKTPATVRGAYGLGNYGSSPVTFSGIQGDGTGQTIAIVDAYDFSTAASDLNAFSTTFGLPTLISNTNLATINNPAGPTFTKVSQTGSTTSLPTSDPDGPYSSTGASTWEQEEALDIEWSHVMAPRANIVLVEANDPGNLLPTAVLYATTIPGVVDVSMSFGGDEFSGETSYDYEFATPAGHLGGAATAGGAQLSGKITFITSAGDSGAYSSGTNTILPQYPAASPNVVAVGGTALTTSGTSYVSESAWGNGTSSGTNGGGGGGVSTQEVQPSYQSSVVSAFSTTKRTYPDISILADPSTGVPIYDSYDFGASTPWLAGYEGGTSLSSPMIAGLVAVADQGRAINGLGSLDGKTATLPEIYSIASSNYHDVTTGNNGYAAISGYDLATGRGTPVGASWINAIANISVSSTGTVSGRVFRDTNSNNSFDGSDTALSGITVYLDENNNSTHDAAEPTLVSDVNGLYSFTGIAAGVTGTVRLITVPTGYVTVSAPSFTVTAGGTSTANYGLFPTAYTDGTNGRVYTLHISATSSSVTEILVNGSSAYTTLTSLISTLSFTFTGVGEYLNVDYANGVAIPSGGISVNGTAAANNDTLTLLGTTGTDTIYAYTGSIQFNGRTVSYSNLPLAYVDPRSGTDAIYLNSGSLGIPNQSSGLLTRTFSTLQLAGSTTLKVAAPASHNNRVVLVMTNNNSLSIGSSAQLDLSGNDMVIRTAPIATYNALLKTGFSNGAWTGFGIASSVAASDTSHRTALGILASGAAITFDGVGINAGDLLIKYTYYGDTDLGGSVDASDYSRIDSGYVTHATGWVSGDLNYDGVVDGSDYTLIDSAFNTQGNPL